MKRYSLAIFDRDGVLIEDRGYLADPRGVVWLPGAIDGICRLQQAGCRVVVATNQSGVARGLMTMDDVESIHQRMQADLAPHGAGIDRFYVCPFHPDARVEVYRHPDHPDRKPHPGMLLQAMRDFGATPRDTFMVGDKMTDIIAAARAGVRAIHYAGGDLFRQLGFGAGGVAA